MKNLIYLITIAIMLLGSNYSSECSDPPKAKPFYVVIVDENDHYTEVPNELIIIDSVKYKEWYCDKNKKFNMNVNEPWSIIPPQ